MIRLWKSLYICSGILLITAAAALAAETPPRKLLQLQAAYPDTFELAYRQEGWGVLFPDDTYIPWDEGYHHRNHSDRLAQPNLKDMFYYDYPALSASGNPYSIPSPAANEDPGRIRHQEFFQAVYGRSSSEVERKLQLVSWLPDASPENADQTLQVTSVQGIAERIIRISEQLEDLLIQHPEYLPYLYPAAGAYYWRTIAGTSRLSTHSFGIALDINPAYGSYWRWDNGSGRLPSELPLAIIRIFENEGFIWGGRWYHYDSFHFEYRPELLPLQ